MPHSLVVVVNVSIRLFLCWTLPSPLPLHVFTTGFGPSPGSEVNLSWDLLSETQKVIGWVNEVWTRRQGRVFIFVDKCNNSWWVIGWTITWKCFILRLSPSGHRPARPSSGPWSRFVYEISFWRISSDGTLAGAFTSSRVTQYRPLLDSNREFDSLELGKKKEQIRRLYFWFIEVIIYFFNCAFTCVLGRCVSNPKCIKKCEDINRVRGVTCPEEPALPGPRPRRRRSAGPAGPRGSRPELSSPLGLLGNCRSAALHMWDFLFRRLACTSAPSCFSSSTPSAVVPVVTLHSYYSTLLSIFSFDDVSFSLFSAPHPPTPPSPICHDPDCLLEQWK